MTIKAIQINKLIASPKNVRKVKSNPQADAELVASIREHDTLLNLLVEPSKKQKGMYEVVDGERRRKALLQLVKENHFKATNTVDCKVVEPDSAEETSYIANTVRLNMHPAEEFEAFTKLINESKLTEDEVAARYGITVKHVKQRLGMAAVHPDILQAYKDGKINLDHVKEFTTQPDQKKQMAVWKKVKGDVEYLEPGEIRDNLKESRITNDSDLVKFVTLKAYQAAGGSSTEDLFGDNVFYITDDELLNRLAIEKLSKQSEKILAEGWKWADKVIKRDHKLEHDHFHLDGKGHGDDKTFNAAQMKLAGCILFVDHGGKLGITKGLVKKEDKAELNKLLNKPSKKAAAKKPDTDTEEVEKAKPVEDESIDLSQSLKTDLRNARETIARLHLAYDPELARDLFIFSICNQILGDADDSTLTMSFGMGLDLPATESIAGQKYCEHYDSLKMSWKDEDLAAAFEKFRNLDSNYKQQLFAFCASNLMHVALFSNDPDHNNDLTESVIKLMQIKWNEYYNPTAENFYKWLNKNQLAELGAKFHDDPEGDWKMTVSKSNKGQLVAKVEELIKTKNPTWIPEGFESK